MPGTCSRSSARPKTRPVSRPPFGPGKPRRLSRNSTIRRAIDSPRRGSAASSHQGAVSGSTPNATRGGAGLAAPFPGDPSISINPAAADSDITSCWKAASIACGRVYKATRLAVASAARSIATSAGEARCCLGLPAGLLSGNMHGVSYSAVGHEATQSRLRQACEDRHLHGGANRIIRTEHAHRRIRWSAERKHLFP